MREVIDVTRNKDLNTCYKNVVLIYNLPLLILLCLLSVQPNKVKPILCIIWFVLLNSFVAVTRRRSLSLHFLCLYSVERLLNLNDSFAKFRVAQMRGSRFRILPL